MPYVNIRLTPPGISTDQKRRVVQGVTQVLQDVLGKDPAHTYVVIDEVPAENWGARGELVSDLMRGAPSAKPAPKRRRKA